MKSFKEIWGGLSPKAKRYSVIGGTATVFAILVILGAPADEDTVVKKDTSSSMANILTDSDTRKIGIESISAEVRRQESENRKVRNRA